MRTRAFLLPHLVVTICGLNFLALGSELKPVCLRCEYAQDPLGVDVKNPRLYWKLESPKQGERQTAYQILVASSQDRLKRDHGDLWDSGKTKSDSTTHIPYGGRTLRSSDQVFWKVRSWGVDGKASGWSEPASWTMGLLQPLDWKAAWISTEAEQKPAPQSSMFRREFAIRRGLRRAIVHVCGLGCYEMTLNGHKVGNALFPPGWTKYDKTCLYDTYNLTQLAQQGTNCVGLLVGNGMYNVAAGRYTKFTGSFGPIKAIAQLVLEYQDGTTEVLGTDSTWRRMTGPITFSCVYGGEDFDARLEPRRWSVAGFNDSAWEPATVCQGPGGSLKGLSCAAPAIRSFEELEPIHQTELRPGVTVYDLGQNASIMPRLKLKGTTGAYVRITPAELIGADGAIDRRSCGGGQAYWQYTLRGDSEEDWFPKFFYHGCRYLQVERVTKAGLQLPKVLSLKGVVVHSSSPAVGDFACSNELFNRIHSLVRWAQRSNMMSVMTDCPHREKLGWLEEDHLNGPSLRYEFDLAQLFTKMMNDMADSQLENGLVPDIAPEYVKFEGVFRDSPEWGSAFILVPWQQYEFTGDTELLRRYYGGMKRYAAYLDSRADQGIVSHGLGDWYDIGPNPPGVAQLTPLPLTATAFYYYDTWILAQTARLLGMAGDASRYEALATQIRSAFTKRFFDPATGSYATGSQCANSIPLVMKLVEAERAPAVLDSIVNDIRQRGNALTAGDVGYRYLLRALAEGGRSDVIYDVNNQSEKPGYGYQLKQGATSLTEAWDAGRSSSQNHFMLGQIMEWFYHDLAGISCDPAGAGFKRIIIKPALAGDLTWVRAKYDSIQGNIESRWARKKDGVTLQVAIPANTTATIYVPGDSPSRVSETGMAKGRGGRAIFLRSESGFQVYSVTSGRYEFDSRY